MIRSSHGTAGRTTTPKKKAGARAALPTARPAGPRSAGPRSRRGDLSRPASGGEKSLVTKGPKKAGAPLSQGAGSLSGSPNRVPAGVSQASDEAREIAVAVAVAALDKKASGLEVIDVAGRVDYADFLVLMSGRSDRHVTALSAAIEEALRKKNKRALAVEGLPHANWVLMDFGDVVVHVFQDDARAAYDIDGLWMDARRVPVPLDESPG
jgi:ribosome-associated protein